MKVRCIFLFCMTVLLVACTGYSGSQIEVQDPWTRMAGMPTDNGSGEMGTNGAAYMVLQNRGDAADKLLRAESDAASAVELHISEMKDGVMSMHPVEYVEIPANSQIQLEPGGLHIMLVDLKQSLEVGESITIKLFFEQFGELTVLAEVRSP